MNISLTPELEKFVETEVRSGLYQTASEVIRAGLRRLKQDKERIQPPSGPKTIEELETRLIESINRFDQGEGFDGEEAFRRLRQRAKKRRAHA